MLGVTFVLANATPGSYANNAGNVSHVNVCVYLTGPADNTQCSPLHRNGGWRRRWYLSLTALRYIQQIQHVRTSGKQNILEEKISFKASY